MKKLKLLTVTLALLSVSSVYASEATQKILDNLTTYPFSIMTVSHRAQDGLESRIFPENSLAAMELAINRGVGIIETDPRLTADGVYIVMHDNTLDRTTNVKDVFPDMVETSGKYKGKFPVNKFTLAQIKQLKLTDGYDGQVHRVPTLKEVLALAKDRVFIDLDLKEFDLPQLTSLIKEYGNENLLAYNSNPNIVKQVTDATGVIPLPITKGLLHGGDPVADFKQFQQMWGKNFKIMHAYLADVSPELVALANQNHVRLWINTLNDADGAAERYDYSLWKSYLNSGATVFQSDLAIELSHFIKLRENCKSIKSANVCSIYY